MGWSERQARRRQASRRLQKLVKQCGRATGHSLKKTPRADPKSSRARSTTCDFQIQPIASTAFGLISTAFLASVSIRMDQEKFLEAWRVDRLNSQRLLPLVSDSTTSRQA